MSYKQRYMLACSYGVMMKDVRSHKKFYRYKLYAPAGWELYYAAGKGFNFNRRAPIEEWKIISKLVRK